MACPRGVAARVDSPDPSRKVLGPLVAGPGRRGRPARRGRFVGLLRLARRPPAARHARCVGREVAGAVSWAYYAWPEDRPRRDMKDAWDAKGRGGGVLPLPPAATDAGVTRWSGIEAGRRVIYVQAIPGGEVVVVDAESGRVVEVR